jgi:hypothetical protein
VRDDIVAKLQAFDFRCAIRQAREIVGDTFVGY